jgi:hypothetical protein
MASDALTAALAQGVISGRTHAAGECMERFKQLLGRHKAEAAQVFSLRISAVTTSNGGCSHLFISQLLSKPFPPLR